MKYHPFLIAPFNTGLDTDLAPWLLPQDAFQEIENGHIHHGYVEKRQGYRFLASLVYGQSISAAINATPVTNPAVFTIASTAALTTGDTVTLHYLAGGTWDTLNGQSYTLTVTSGTTFTLTDSAGTAVGGTSFGTYTANSGRLGTFDAERIMGIFRYIASDNTRLTLVSDTKRVGLYNTSTNLIDPLDLYDIGGTLRTNNDVFSSSNTDYIWAANWQSAGLVNRVYFTNGKEYQTGTPGTDGIVYYDATNRGSPASPNVVQFQPSLSSSATLTFYGCKFIFSIRQRLLCLYTYEFNGSSTSTFPQRARWCAAQDPTNWDQSTAGGGGFVDAPTGEQIISATQLQDIIIVHFTDSVWSLRPVPDPALPFRWDRINSFRSCDGKMASVGFDRYAVSLGFRGIVATDGVETRRVDNRIEDFVTDDINADQFDKVFVERSYSNRRTWFLYPGVESSDADKALIYDDESGAYSKYDISMNVIGHGAAQKDYAAEDFTAANDLDISALDLDDETALSFFWSSSAEILLGGDRSGNIHVLETLNADDGTAISFTLIGAGWNPFKEQGVEAQLGYVDFYFDSDQETRLDIQFYKNDSENPYTSQALDLLPNLNFLTNITDIVPNSDPTTGFVVNSPSHGLSSSNEVYFYGVKGAKFYNDRQWTVGATVTDDTFSVDEDLSSFGNAITGISQASAAVVTSASHNLSVGEYVIIVGVSGMTEINGQVSRISAVTTNTFTLQDIDSTAYTAYSSGGFAFLSYQSGGVICERKFYRTKVWKRAYAGGIGYVHSIKVIQEDSKNPLKIHAIKPWCRPRGKRTLG